MSYFDVAQYDTEPAEVASSLVRVRRLSQRRMPYGFFARRFYLSLARVCKNQETKERTIEASTAVRKLSISNPGTIKLVNHKSKTLIKNAAIPKVTSVMGSAIICNIGLMKVFTTPITIAVTTADHKFAKTNPGIR